MTDKENNFEKDINVPSKEQIMIDGVDIMECDYYYVEQETDQIKCDKFDGYCREHKNCLFKQLARKTQECNLILEAHKILSDEYKRVSNNLKEDIDRYRKALEEIEGIAVKNNITEFDFGGCTDLLKIIVNLAKDYGDILDIINKAKGE